MQICKSTSFYSPLHINCIEDTWVMCWATYTWLVRDGSGWTTFNVEDVRRVSINVRTERGAVTAVHNEMTCRSPAMVTRPLRPLRQLQQPRPTRPRSPLLLPPPPLLQQLLLPLLLQLIFLSTSVYVALIK